MQNKWEEYEKRRRSTKTWRFGITYQFQDISKAFRKLLKHYKFNFQHEAK